MAPRLEVRGTYAGALLRSTHKIAVAASQNAFPQVEVAKSVGIADGNAGIG
ncbi:hypothetical protein Arad_2287 [Rhizobium rhizogenes K84]|uniref:Uncharacterized protein n=1 Tax=Rhizobium rhizogenes (strain K84 / ATCC BAA-868) TaxID=311403 RepID=B9JF19_RHIR8|nr:hypothetical protein Arad_2287 [Rhizobium rhizogenes K84]